MGFQNGLRALIFISVLQGFSTKITFPIESSIDSDRQYIRSLEITDAIDSGELYSTDRKLRDDGRWNGWNQRDENKRWNPPDEKTISFQLVDDDPYQHGRPSWPHDEYLLSYFDLNGIPGRNSSSDTENENPENSNSNSNDLSKYYEWKKLQPRPSPSAFIGPGFYDVGSSSNYYGTTSPDYYRYQPTHQAITEGTGNVQSTQSNAEAVPGTPSESTTNTRHFRPYVPFDNYKRKRLRLQIHPGLIAAPLAGLAAFGAASALTSKPLLLELGYVRNKQDFIGAGGQGNWGGWGGAQGGGYRPYPPFYPPPNLPPQHHHHHQIGPPLGGLGGLGGLGLGGGGVGHAHATSGVGPVYPILRPVRARPDGDRSWWNPFSALTPRLVVE